MSSVTQDSPVASLPPSNQRARRVHVVEAVLAGLFLLAAIGIGVTDFTPYYGFWYWLAMVPVFGAASLYTAWSHNLWEGTAGSTIVRTQVLHWVGAIVAVHLAYLLLRSGRMTNEAAGLVALLTLALATFLSGVYGDWRFCLVGILLGAMVGAAAFVEEFLWLLLIPSAVVVVIGVIWSWRARRSATSPAT